MPSPIVGLFAGPVIVMGGAALALLSPDTNEEGVNWTSTSGAWLLVVLSLLSMVIETELPAVGHIAQGVELDGTIAMPLLGVGVVVLSQS